MLRTEGLDARSDFSLKHVLVEKNQRFVAVGSHIQRTVDATEETMVTRNESAIDL